MDENEVDHGGNLLSEKLEALDKLVRNYQQRATKAEYALAVCKTFIIISDRVGCGTKSLADSQEWDALHQRAFRAIQDCLRTEE